MQQRTSAARAPHVPEHDSAVNRSEALPRAPARMNPEDATLSEMPDTESHTVCDSSSMKRPGQANPEAGKGCGVPGLGVGDGGDC